MVSYAVLWGDQLVHVLEAKSLAEAVEIKHQLERVWSEREGEEFVFHVRESTHEERRRFGKMLASVRLK
jgi:hypothetical protein